MNSNVGKFSVLAINRHRMKVDGRGVTTLVALSGCPLSCPYCINAKVLKNTVKTEEISPQELVQRLAIDHCYFVYTGGGVTFGGGEALLHSRQIVDFAQVCPTEWKINIETSLNVDADLLKPLLTDRFCFIIDIKAVQPDIYLTYTGQKNEQVLHNLEKIAECMPRENYVVKIPVIPDYSNRTDAEHSAAILHEMGIPTENIVIFPYLKENQE